MTEITAADHLRSDVLAALEPHLTDVTAANTSAELWHSGGGIIGLKVTVGRSELFTTLEADGDQAFVITDWTTIARSRPRWSDDLMAAFPYGPDGWVTHLSDAGSCPVYLDRGDDLVDGDRLLEQDVEAVIG